MPLPSRRVATALIVLTASLGLVGVSAALEGEDPSLGEPEPEFTCPDDGATDDAVVTDEGAAEEDATDDEAVTDDSTVEATTDEATTDDAVTDEDADDDEECEEPAADVDDVTDDETEVTTEETTTDHSAAPESGPVDNHGAAVSQAAHDCPAGPEHGPCVRDVAHSDAGKKAKGEDESVEAGDDVESEGADATSPGKGHGKGHAGGGS